MKITQTKLKGCFIVEPKVFKDNRGYFFESFNASVWEEKTGNKIKFVQDNESFSEKGVLRGLHFQKAEHSQAKLVRVIKGKVQDVAVDLRPKSETFGHYVSVELSESNKKQLFVPRGFAHGFLVLEDNTIFSYKCDNYYNKDSESGIIFNDVDLNINWNLPEDELIISGKDQNLPTFNSIKNAM